MIYNVAQLKPKETTTTKKIYPTVITNRNSTIPKRGSYNPLTGVYTDAEGNKFSTTNPPVGTPNIIIPTRGGGGGGSSGGSSSGTYNRDTGVYINPQGQGFSYPTAPPGATITTTSKPSLSSQQLSYARQQQNKPDVYISSQQGWKPKNTSNRDYLVIYSKKGRTTGQTNIPSLNIPSDIRLSGNYSTAQGTKQGSELISFEYEKQPADILFESLSPSYDINKSSYFDNQRQGYSIKYENVPYGTSIKGKSQTLFTKNPPIEPSTIFTKVMDFTAGESGKKYIGIGIPETKAFVSGEQIYQGVNKASDTKIGKYMFTPISTLSLFKPLAKSQQTIGSYTMKVGAELIPTTPLGVALTTGGYKIFTKIPASIQFLFSGYTAYEGGKTVMSKGLPIEQKIAGGLTGGLGIVGGVFTAYPYLKTGYHKYAETKDIPFVSIKKQFEGYKAIEVPKTYYNVKPEIYVKESPDIYFKKPSVIQWKKLTGENNKYVTAYQTSLTKYDKEYYKSIFPKDVKKISTSKRVIVINPSITFYSIRGKRLILSHEIIHSKLPTWFNKIPIKLKVPYRLQPTEKIAYAFQKKYATKGFTLTKKFLLGIIPRGSPLKSGSTKDVLLPKTSILKKGAFGFSKKEKMQFLGDNQILSTSQIGLFKVGINNKLVKPLFSSPQESNLKIPVTRESRLGLNEGLFKFPKDTQIGFGLPKEAQIGLRRGDVTLSGRKGSDILGMGTSEVEVTNQGTIINVRKIGYSSLKGQSVTLYGYNLKDIKKFNKNQQTTIEGTRISGESILGFSGTRMKTTNINPTTLININKFSLITTPTTTKNIMNTSINITKGITYTTSKSRGKSYTTSPTTLISTNKINYNKIITKPITYNKIYPYPKPVKYTEQIYNFGREPSKRINIFPTFSKPKQSSNNFQVLMRRFGKFKSVGITKTSQEAFNLGKFKTGTSLGATFKVEGSTQQPTNIFGYKKKKTKEGILFIEQPKFRLSTGSEKKEINYYRNLAKKIQMKGGRL